MASRGYLRGGYKFSSAKKYGTYYALGRKFVVNKHNRLLAYGRNHTLLTIFHYKLLGDNTVYLISLHTGLTPQLNRIPYQYFLSCFKEIVFDDFNIRILLLETLPELRGRIRISNNGSYVIIKNNKK